MASQRFGFIPNSRMYNIVATLLLLSSFAAGDKERLRRRPALEVDYRIRQSENLERWLAQDGRSAASSTIGNNLFNSQDVHGKSENSGSYFDTISRENSGDVQSLSDASSAADYVIRALKMRDKAYAPQFHTFSESSSMHLPHYSSIGDSSTMQLPAYKAITIPGDSLQSSYKSNMNPQNMHNYGSTGEDTSSSQINDYHSNADTNGFQPQPFRSSEDTNPYRISSYKSNNADIDSHNSVPDGTSTQFQSYDAVVLSTQKQAERVAQQYADEYMKTIEQGTLKLQQEQDELWRSITGTPETPLSEPLDGARRIEHEKLALLHSKASQPVNTVNTGNYNHQENIETTKWGYGNDQNNNNEEDGRKLARDRTNHHQMVDLTFESEQDRKSTAKRVLPPYQRLATYIGQVEDHRGADEFKDTENEDEQYNSHAKIKGRYLPSRENFKHNSVRYTNIHRPNTRDYSVQNEQGQQHRSNVDMEQLISHAKEYHAHLNARNENRGQEKEEVRYNVVEDGQHLLSIPQSLVSILRQMGSVTAGTPVQEIKVMSMQITPQMSTPEPTTAQAEEPMTTTTTTTTPNPQHIIVSADKPQSNFNHMPITMINGLPVYNPYNVDLETLRKILSSPMMIPTESGGHFKVVPLMDDQSKRTLHKNEESMYGHLREPQRDSWEGAESQHREVRDSAGRRGKKAKKLRKKHVETGSWGGGSWVEGLLPEPSTQLTPPPK